MDIQELDQMFERGAYQDLYLSEYEFMRAQMRRLQPQRVTVIGGHTCLDLFYSLQEVEGVEVINHDPGPGKLAERGHRALMAEYQRLTHFRGRYQWLDRGITHHTQLGHMGDCLVINAHHAIAWEPVEWPPTVIMYHYGQPGWFDAVREMDRRVPLRVFGARMAWLDQRQEHQWQSDTYLLKPKQWPGIAQATWELVK